MILEISQLSITEDICGDKFVYLHNLNPNVESEARIYNDLKERAETNRILKKYGYKGIY